MAYDAGLALRVRAALAGREGVTERTMFGGLAFFLRGHICVGVWKESLLARLGADEAEAAQRDRRVRPFDVTGRPMTGWVLIAPEVVADDETLDGWVRLAERFVATLPARDRSP